MTTATQCLEMIQYWTAQQDSEQKKVVLAYWVKQCAKFTNCNTCFKDTLTAIKALALFYKVPAKKKGETISKQVHRLTAGKGYTLTIEQVLKQL